MNRIGIVADDLTGVFDTGHGFAQRGYETRVVVTPCGRAGDQCLPGGTVVGYNTDSRYLDASAAAARVAEVVKMIPARVYKKVDSTLRGNVSAEVDAALQASGASMAIFAPAYPAQGRTTLDGVHYVDGQPIDETTYADDTKGPATAVIEDLFGGLDRPLRHLSVEHLKGTSEDVHSVLQTKMGDSDVPPIVIVDAVKTVHLERLGEAIASLDALAVGSGGLAKHLRLLEDRTGATPAPVSTGGGPLAVVGSVNPATLEQLGRVPDEAVSVVEPATLVAGTIPHETVEGIAERLHNGRPVVLTGAIDEDAVEQTLTAGKRQGLSASTVRERVAATLAATGVAATQAAPISALLLTGGDLALSTLGAAGATTVSLSGTSIADGIPVGIVEDGELAGNPLVTKAGGFGGPNALLTYLEWFGQT